MITPISKAGKAVIHQFADEEARVPAALKPFIFSPAELKAGEMRTAPEFELRSSYEIQRDTILGKFR